MTIAVSESMDIAILWKRGSKKIDTLIKQISPENNQCVFNEKFQMKTQLEWDSLRNQFRPKKSTLSVHQVRKGESIMLSSTDGSSIVLGEADFDLAHYANNPKLL